MVVGGLVLKAHRLSVSLNSRLESNKEKKRGGHTISRLQVGVREARECLPAAREGVRHAGFEGLSVAMLTPIRQLTNERVFLLLAGSERTAFPRPEDSTILRLTASWVDHTGEIPSSDGRYPFL